MTLSPALIENFRKAKDTDLEVYYEYLQETLRDDQEKLFAVHRILVERGLRKEDSPNGYH